MRELTRTMRWLLVVAMLAAVTGCATTRRGQSVPIKLMEQAQVPGMPHIRTWGDQVDDWYIESLVNADRQEAAYYAAHPEESLPPTEDILALSGGGQNGAFGAGLLCGWSTIGDRPQFKLVTGISTGALIAPLAFLGPEYDPILRRAYTTIEEEDVLDPRFILAIMRKDALADTEPLGELIQEWLTPAMFEAVAVEHAKGRRLLIATVNLEAQRPVIWDMGAVASSGHPRALDLFRKIMLASASIPGAFEPQYFRVEVNGETYEELHVDGGTMAQVFLWGAGVNVRALGDRLGADAARRPIRLFVVRNGLFQPEPQQIKGLFIDIAGRAVATLIKTQGIGDMFRLYTIAQESGMEFNLAHIPPSFTHESKAVFDQEYMNALFQFGYDQARGGALWNHKPPYLHAGVGTR